MGKSIFVDGKKVGEVLFFLDNLRNESDQSNYIIYVLESFIKGNNLEDLGFSNFIEFKTFISNSILGKSNEIINLNISSMEKRLFDNIENVVALCSKLLGDFSVKIFVHFTLDPFVRDNLNGINGFSTNKGIIIIPIYPKKEYGLSLKETVVHELSHALSPYYDIANLSIGEGLVLDGIAENFIKEILPDYESLFSKVLSHTEAINIFKKLITNLNIRDDSFYKEIFFGTGKYPKWTGYAIGYYLIKDYLNSLNKISWKDIINTSPNKILSHLINKYR